MISIFRKVRKGLFQGNRFNRYLLYAIGEILLVVIGILIALKVNNINESQKKETKIMDTLAEIHRDLSEDILESNALIAKYSREDSMINILMTEQMSVEDYRDFQGMVYASTALSYYDLRMNTNGFDKLMLHSDQIPAEHQAFVEMLKGIYVQDKNQLEMTFAFASDELSEYLQHLALNMDWYSDFVYHFNPPDEAIDYFLHDPKYKNHLAQYSALAIGNYYRTLYNFRVDAEACYQELTSLLELEEEIISDSTLYYVDANNYTHLLGTYKGPASSERIFIDSGRLYLQAEGQEKVGLFPISQQAFVHGLNQTFNTIIPDTLGPGQRHHWHFVGQKGTLVRQDSSGE